MNQMDTKRRAAVIAALVEGVGIRATCRMTGASKGAVTKLIEDLGTACAEYHHEHVRNLPCKRLQLDEIWSFCYAKSKNVPANKKGEFGFGDVWTWTAICADTKIIPAWLVGSRDGGCATELAQDLAGRLTGRVQLTSDGLGAYVSAIEDAFGGAVDFAQLQKIYGPSPEGPERRYSPAGFIGARVEVISGDPAPEHVSTSFVERSNLSIRMGLRRYTRLTNAHSKKIDNHIAAFAIYVMHYNYCRPHQTLATKRNNKITPAMACGLAERPWTLEQLVSLLPPPVAKKRGPYKPRNSK